MVVRANVTFSRLGTHVSDPLIVRCGSTIVLLKALPTTEHDAAILLSLGPAAVKKLS